MHFLDNLSKLSPNRKSEFTIDLTIEKISIFKLPYIMTILELVELNKK